MATQANTATAAGGAPVVAGPPSVTQPITTIAGLATSVAMADDLRDAMLAHIGLNLTDPLLLLGQVQQTDIDDTANNCQVASAGLNLGQKLKVRAFFAQGLIATAPPHRPRL